MANEMSGITTHEALLVRLRAAVVSLGKNHCSAEQVDDMVDEVADALAAVRLDRERLQRQVESLRQQVIDAAGDRVRDAVLTMAEDAMRDAHRRAMNESLMMADLQRARAQRQRALLALEASDARPNLDNPKEDR
ncbi:MAG: hypothetical protein KC583_19240 [Myxococcales bacterium]|nr:hypothetical protein [Myxococcales bacterium]